MAAPVLNMYRDEGRVDPGLECKDESLTQQHMANDCDINEIVRRFEATGQVHHVQQKAAMYGDFTEFPDLRSALGAISAVQDTFAQLPAAAKERFGNDPVAMVDWLRDPQNREEGIRLGLILPKDGSGPKGAESGADAPVGQMQPPVGGK